MSQAQTDRATQVAAAALARRAGQRAGQQLARSAAVRLGGRIAARGLSALLFKAGGVLSAKAIAIGAIVLVIILLVGCALALLISGAGAAFQHTALVWPVAADVQPDGSYRAGGWAIASPFGWRVSPFSGQAEFHDGIDIISPTGACPFAMGCALPAMLDGVVTYVGWDQAGAADPQASGGGQIVMVENGEEDHTILYAHLEPYRLHVQLQGRIIDRHGRYDDWAEYRPIGEGELTPNLGDGAIAIWCAPDMPSFRASRSGPGTVSFVYDRPARCQTSVAWGTKGDGWEGWSADEPAADRDGRATLAWQTPLVSGQRAGDVALRFRAHLVPPPPPPTATPTPVAPELVVTPVALAPQTRSGAAWGMGAMGQGGEAPGAPAAGQPERCERAGSGVRCVWRLATIPLLRPVSPSAAGAGSVVRRSATLAQAAPTPALDAAPLAVSVSASRQRVPIGGHLTIAVSVFSGGARTTVPMAIDSDGAVAVRDARTSQGTCSISGSAVACEVAAGAGAPATVAIVLDVLPGNAPGGRLTVMARAGAGERRAIDTVTLELAPYAVTPEVWPPPTTHPTATATEMALPTATAEAVATPAPTTAPVGEGPGPAPVSCAPQALIALPGVVNAGGASNARLIAPAAAAFQAARAEVLARTGQDALARLADVLRAPEFRSEKPGVARMSWHMTGRAVDLDTGAPWRRVRKGRVWRLYLGTADVTAIMERHGFTRIPDRDDSPEWWHYEYRADSVAWASAMLQVWPLARLQRAFPEIAWSSVGCQRGTPEITEPLADNHDRCVPGAPSFSGAVEELAGCGPPVRAGDRVYQLDSTLGFIGMTGSTTGPHLHLGLRVRAYDGAAHPVNVCTTDWLQGMTPPPDATCWTEMADPLAFLPLAPPPAHTEKGTTAATVIPEGAPWQLPPPNYPGSLLAEPPPESELSGQYWSPYQDGGRYGGGGALEWFADVTCRAWGGFPWCSDQ